MKKFTILAISLAIISLASQIEAASVDTDCWITNWQDLYRVLIPKTSKFYN